MSWIIDQNLDPKLQDWGEVYKELCAIIKAKLPEIKHIDLYYGQDQVVDQDGNWVPFRAPAIFMEFAAPVVSDLGDNTQQLTMDITMYLCMETVQDTNHGSAGQRRAMEFIGVLRKMHMVMHGAEGQHFSPLSRVALAKKADAPPYMYMYGQTYRCVILDNSTSKQYDFAAPGSLGLEIEPYSAPPVTDDRLVVVRNSDNSYSVEVEAPGEHVLPNVTHVDSNGQERVLPAMEPMVCTPGGVSAPVLVRNSDNSYSVSATDTHLLPDVIHQDTDGSPVVLPGMTAMVCSSPAPVVILQSDANPSIPIAVVNAGELYPLPQTVIQYVRRDGTGGQTIGANTRFIGPPITPEGAVPRATLRNSAGDDLGKVDLLHLLEDNLPIAPNATVLRDGTPYGSVKANGAIDVPSNCPVGDPIIYAFGTEDWSGQSASYRANDERDAWVNGFYSYAPVFGSTSQKQHLTNWFTLGIPNVYGNNNRFTSLDGSAYATSGERVFVDHLKGLVWYIVGDTLLSGVWNTAIDWAAGLSHAGITDWILPPMKVWQTVALNQISGNVLDYGPFGIAASIFLWSGTTSPASTAQALRLSNALGAASATNKTGANPYGIAVARFNP